MPSAAALNRPSRSKKLNTISDVIDVLEEIILESEKNNDPLGYFAVLYQSVTQKIKEGIDQGFFDDGPRMERLDIVFAERYLEAYYAYRNNEPVTGSWRRAFALSTAYWPIVLQHLLIGVNAHINLDLGIAAAQISKGKRIDDLENDFIKINEILSSLVDKVQHDLADIWPLLRPILKRTGKVDNVVVDFSMKIAREGAWKFARRMAEQPGDQWTAEIAVRDEKVARKADLITRPGAMIALALRIIRTGERGSVADKIQALRM